jgi:hypothetical protein
MGICQTVGGAATSGRGLSGAQVAAAIRLASSAQRQRLADRVAQQSGGSHHRRTRSVLIEGLDELDDNSYTATAVSKITRKNARGEDEEIIVTEYAPEVFRFLRQLEGVQESRFCDEWDLPVGKSEMELGEGRSMAMFLKSVSMEFMCKTIADVETNVLLGILKNLTKHLARHKDSLLMRFLMILKVEVGAETGYILCFGDVFSPCDALHERWDIKGRIPKPGKYLHFPKFVARLDQHGREVKGESTEAPSPQKDLGVDSHLDSQRLITRKDKDLTRLFWMEPNVREELVTALLNDFEFLYGNGMMDYSMLIGVRYNDQDNESMRMKFALGQENLRGIKEQRPRAKSSASREASPDPSVTTIEEPLPEPLSTTSVRHKANSIFFNGISSIEGHETYYIGIIDMLTVYNMKKKSANFFKKFLWSEETLSTVPPEMYRDRIKSYAKRIFPEIGAAAAL